jgi:hypothetical protein
MDIDAVIAAGTTAPADKAQPQADATTLEKPAEPSEPVDSQPKDEPWPTKAQNALSHQKGKTAQWRAQAQQERRERERLQAEVERLSTQSGSKPAPVKSDGRPDEKSYQSYAEYLEAVQDWKLDSKLAERDGKQKETRQTEQEKAWIAEREATVATKAQEFAKENPEVLAMVEEYGDVVDELPPQIQRLFLEADNAPLAFFNLAKEGKLESLGTMSLAKAAMEIGRAQTQAPTKQQSKAPAPLPASRGSVSPGKSLDQMQGKELLSWSKS